ncbi:MAG TPA: hypothetical protein VHE30_19040, partial [Polyangiaceae bacterium]|nr:hypothetical protein [Polyangiaceae bacterium]
MSRGIRSLVFLTPLFVTALGCSSHADDPPPYQSGVDENTQLTNLTPAEKTQICTSQAAFVHARVDTTSLTRFWCAFTPAVFGAA